MEQEPITVDQNTVIFKSDDTQVRRMVIAPKGKVDKHYHTACTDIILPLSGTASLLILETKTYLLPNTLYKIKPPEIHTLLNESAEEPFVYLLIQHGTYDFIRV